MRQDGGRLIAWALLACLGVGCRDISIRRVGPERNPPAGMRLDATGAFVPIAAGRPDLPEPLAEALARATSGRGAAGASREIATTYDLDALNRAAAVLAAGGRGTGGLVGPDLVAARAIYNDALGNLLRVTSGRKIRLDDAWQSEMAALGIRLTVRRDGEVWSPGQFDVYIPSADFEVHGLEPFVRTEGVGVPMVAERRFRLSELESRRGPDKFLMPRQVEPVTAVLQVSRPGNPAVGRAPEYRLELHDPLRTGRIPFAGGMQPLAADLSTSLAYHFARSPLPVLQEVGLLDPQWLEKLSGLYMLHPYERGKIPVILVHGLRSSPVAWTKVINELRGDPALRARYQFWLFMYPTGTPFPYSAAKLRDGLAELRQVVDPGHADPALDRTVLIGHSMGGLISKMLIMGSGDALWRLVSTRPFESLQATPERRQMLKQVFFFEPVAAIERVIFVATPHRGSELGDQFIGRLTDRLIRLPGSLRATYRTLLFQNGRDFFTPSARRGLPSSIDELKRDNPLLMTLSRIPFRPGVVYHSIIGQKEPGPIPSGSDGVVPYVSSHLDGAASELIVRGDHGCQDEPDTIRDLRRILYVHLGKLPPADLDSQGVPPRSRPGADKLKPERALDNATE